MIMYNDKCNNSLSNKKRKKRTFGDHYRRGAQGTLQGEERADARWHLVVRERSSGVSWGCLDAAACGSPAVA